MSRQATTEFALVERIEAHRRLRLSLVDEGVGEPLAACSLTIDRLTMHDGAGGVVMLGGIGNVATATSYRRRGLATRLLRIAVERMRSERLDGSLLYGIDHFYEPLGWRTCGDERWVRVTLEAPDPGRAGDAWTARAATSADLDALAVHYGRVAAATPGALEREAGGRAWGKLAFTEVRIVERAGELAGWAWRGRGLHERDSVAEHDPGCVAFAELHAVDDEAMLAVLACARAWARDDPDDPATPARALLVGAPESHPLRRLARAGALGCRLVDEVRPHGGAMLLPFTSRAVELGTDLYQYLPDRF